jgi:uncharacterized repeat protein (TIGR04138 family)
MPDDVSSEAIELLAKGSPYDAEAYEFALEAMNHAFAEWNDKEPAASEMPSEQLVVALRRLASERFGQCATRTFNLWGITRWKDFSEIVARMREAKISLFKVLTFNPEDFKSRGVLDDVFPER